MMLPMESSGEHSRWTIFPLGYSMFTWKLDRSLGVPREKSISDIRRCMHRKRSFTESRRDLELQSSNNFFARKLSFN